MGWQPPIRCTGRRYPNGPLPARMGCLERPAPYYFGVESPGLSFEWPPVGELLPMHWIGTIDTTFGVNYQNQWHWGAQVPGPTPPSANCWTWFNFVSHQPNLRLVLSKFGGVSPFFAEYNKPFPGGFPKWPAFYDLPLFSGSYPDGAPAPAIMRVFIVSYDQMPAGSCISGGV
jgi:hypothetical protein